MCAPQPQVVHPDSGDESGFMGVNVVDELVVGLFCLGVFPLLFFPSIA